jgi:hypothetical protein
VGYTVIFLIAVGLRGRGRGKNGGGGVSETDIRGEGNGEEELLGWEVQSGGRRGSCTIDNGLPWACDGEFGTGGEFDGS